MQVTFFSNFLNHHQIPFCDEMFKQLKGNFTFVSTERMPLSFIQNGYKDSSDYVYNLNSYSDNYQLEKAIKLGLDSDIVIIGSAPDVFIKERLQKNKLTFRYSERLLKKSEWRLLDPRVLLSFILSHTIYRKKNLYMLCASAYTANDLNLIFAYPQKMYKWGYFTNVEKLNIDQIIAQKPTERVEIIWAARFIDWKHPELAVKLAYELKKKGYNFHLNMIGNGDMLDYIRILIQKLDVHEFITLLGSMPNQEVIDYMKKSNIFIFTSDRNEGWGAVLNEAMSCGCAVITSNTIGAAPYLVEHRKTGLIFESNNLISLLMQIEYLLLDPSLRNQLSKNAYYSLVNEWNPKKAAVNFILLAKSILSGRIVTIENGPCSRAESTSKKFWRKA